MEHLRVYFQSQLRWASEDWEKQQRSGVAKADLQVEDGRCRRTVLTQSADDTPFRVFPASELWSVYLQLGKQSIGAKRAE